MQAVAIICPISDVCIDERRLPLFIARATLRELIAGLQARATGERQRVMPSLHKNATTPPAIRAKIAASDVLKTNHSDSALDLEQTLGALCPSLQHATAAVRPEEPNADASDEGLAQIPPAHLHQSAP